LPLAFFSFVHKKWADGGKTKAPQTRGAEKQYINKYMKRTGLFRKEQA